MESYRSHLCPSTAQIATGFSCLPHASSTLSTGMTFTVGTTVWPPHVHCPKKCSFPPAQPPFPESPKLPLLELFPSRLLCAPSRALGIGLGVDGSICCPHALCESRVHIFLSHAFLLFTIERHDLISASPVFLLLCSQTADCDLGSELYCQQ